MTINEIEIHNLRLRTRIGVRDWEKEKPQDVVLSIVLAHDRSMAGRTDELADAVDYKTLKDEVARIVEGSQYALLEALAERVADVCLKVDGVERVEVRIDKPGALRFADSVGVRIVRP